MKVRHLIADWRATETTWVRSKSACTYTTNYAGYSLRDQIPVRVHVHTSTCMSPAKVVVK